MKRVAKFYKLREQRSCLLYVGDRHFVLFIGKFITGYERISRFPGRPSNAGCL